MKYTSVDLVEIIQDCNNNNNTRLEQLGYIKDDELTNKYVYVYKDMRINSIVVILKGYNKEEFPKDFTLTHLYIFNHLKNINEHLAVSESLINNICERYSDTEITFIGHSLGGLLINKQLNNTKHKCYTYNPFLVDLKSSDNIKNYRANLDLGSLGLIGKEEKTIYINFIDYLVTKKGNIFDLLLDSHDTKIFTLYDDLEIPIDILTYQ